MCEVSSSSAKHSSPHHSRYATMMSVLKRAPFFCCLLLAGLTAFMPLSEAMTGWSGWSQDAKQGTLGMQAATPVLLERTVQISKLSLGERKAVFHDLIAAIAQAIAPNGLERHWQRTLARAQANPTKRLLLWGRLQLEGG